MYNIYYGIFKPLCWQFLPPKTFFLRKHKKKSRKVLVVIKKALNLQQKTIKTSINNKKLSFMKKRILLSLVSFFAMTAMWASITEAYQIYVTAGANGKTYSTAELTLNMKNRNAIAEWTCILVLPQGVTFKSASLVDGRYPEGYEAEFDATANDNGTVTLSCSGAEGVALTGTDGAIATVEVEIAGDAPLGDCIIDVAPATLTEVNGDGHTRKNNEFTWTIEQGEEPQPEIPGDLNGDTKVDIADAVTVLNLMAAGEYDPKADLNEDTKVDIADFVTVLNIMATGAE